ncbi:MAG: NAD(P)H-quinone oxidoreductase [Rubrivivax sp.]|nr:NAD(P)H-quinone oxidoreductase [Rubrivivax sp.]MCA3258618.1 NAD(P)H-quinone oxidoreductase [Rubrivivax sp.]MCZ8030192.1 NAD(P)H-quinone oxidoreductase [Rubrivivax sp.]
MRAIEITRFGPPEVLQPVTRPDPVPAAGEVLIEVHASGVNRPDVMQRKGMYPMPPGVSDLPGLEVAGTVAGGAAADLQAAGLRLGDPVCALLAGGGYAERCVAPVGQVLPVPAGLSMIEAAGLPETFFTVWQNVFSIARLQPGQALLVQGGTSGIGVTAIQLAKARGASVIATAGSDEKCAACVALGADRAVNYRTQDFVAESLEFTGGRGVDVVLDMVAGDYVERELQCLAEDGRLALIAVQGGTSSRIDAGLVLRRRLSITGSTLRPRQLAYKAALARELRAEVWPLLESGRIRPVVHRVLPAAAAAAAHALMESSQHVGKIVLAWKEERT